MIDNANRAGVVAYMTVQEFQRARSEDDRHVVHVLQHKTVDTHGPAQTVLTNHLYIPKRNVFKTACQPVH